MSKGLFTSNVDSSLVLATHPSIASEFNSLEDSSWIFVGFLLGGVATQVLVSTNTPRCLLNPAMLNWRSMRNLAMYTGVESCWYSAMHYSLLAGKSGSTREVVRY